MLALCKSGPRGEMLSIARPGEIQAPAPAPSKRCRVCIGKSFQTSPCFLRSRLTPCNTTGFCCVSSSHGVLALGLSLATLRPYAEPPRVPGTAWRRSGFSDTEGRDENVET